MNALPKIRADQLFSLVKRQPHLLRALNTSAVHADKTKPILYCVHSLSGMVTEFLPVATKLDSLVQVFGFQVPRQRMRDPDFAASVAGLANTYADCISQSQPEGPIYLTGLSAGGLVAHEMAVRLTHRGRQVGLVAILDTVPYANQPEIRPWELPYLAAVARNLPYWLAHELERRDLGIRRWADRAARKTGAATGWAAYRFNGPEASPAHPIHRFIDLAGYLDDHQAFICRFFDAITRHHPRSDLPGQLIVYEAMVKPLLRPAPAGKVWQAYVADVTVIRVRSTHNDMVKPPHVDKIAADLAARIGFVPATEFVTPRRFGRPRASDSWSEIGALSRHSTSGG